MSLRRRNVLAGSAALVASLSGCQDLVRGDPPHVDLRLYNYTDRVQPIKLEILRMDRNEYAEAAVVNREFEVPPPSNGETAGVVDESDVAERRRYLLRVLPKYGTGERFTYHFYPRHSSDDADAERFDVRIYRDEGSDEPYVRFV